MGIDSPVFFRLVPGIAYSVLLPVGLLIWWRVTRRARLAPFFAGALVFLMFAMGLEQGLHYLCLVADNPVSRTLNGNPWLYALYGALAAGVFEESGRFAAFRWLIGKRRHPGRDTAVTYGIGHGGMESVMVLGLTYVLYLVVALYLSAGNEPAALAVLKGNTAALSAARTTLAQITSATVWMAMLERTAAVLLHIALSCFVFLAARGRNKLSYYPFAILLHALADLPAAFAARGMLSVSVAELWLWVVTLYALRSARKCYLEEMDP